MDTHPAPPPPTYQLDWETPRAPRRSKGVSRFLPFTIRRHHHPPAAAKEADLSPLPTHTAPRRSWHSAPARRKIFLNLRRRTLLLILLALVILILALGLGLGLGLRRPSEPLPLPDGTSALHTGELTYYAPGLGACGVTSSEGDNIVALSHLTFDGAAERAGTGANPNANPLCGKKIAIEMGGRTEEVTVVDRCTGCKPKDLDVPVEVFRRLAEEGRGRVEMKWRWM